MALLRNATTGAIVATRVDRVTGLFQRMIGLLPRSSLECDEGVWLTPCRAIHTIGMRVSIDAIFVDRDGCVLRVEHAVAPNLLALSCRRAKGVIELGGGGPERSDVLVGDRLELL